MPYYFCISPRTVFNMKNWTQCKCNSNTLSKFLVSPRKWCKWQFTIMKKAKRFHLFRVTTFVGVILYGSFSICLFKLILTWTFWNTKNFIIFGVITLLWSTTKHCECNFKAASDNKVYSHYALVMYDNSLEKEKGVI